ncbi:hypothetical protein AYO38_05240 [bacterium SCGC AG-212-C10]|nr:hypothetical protein AYO38_05180 [bacterium SCGC AG-212-C10]OAI40772.1 hypothetical protein AYO38_05240 [bacterium SCGC AG-212-C10]
MKEINVSELSAHTQDYVEAASGGETIVVCDASNRAIALLVRANDSREPQGASDRPRWSDSAPFPPLKTKLAFDSVKSLREDRDSR